MFDIIIPIFRISEEFLIRALDSISNQEIDEDLFEVFVVDGTPKKYQDYNAKELVGSYGKNFFYLCQSPDRKLVGGARNQGVSVGTNPYLAFLDGDDYWYASYLREMAQEIEAQHLDLDNLPDIIKARIFDQAQELITTCEQEARKTLEQNKETFEVIRTLLKESPLVTGEQISYVTEHSKDLLNMTQAVTA